MFPGMVRWVCSSRPHHHHLSHTLIVAGCRQPVTGSSSLAPVLVLVLSTNQSHQLFLIHLSYSKLAHRQYSRRLPLLRYSRLRHRRTIQGCQCTTTCRSRNRSTRQSHRLPQVLTWREIARLHHNHHCLPLLNSLLFLHKSPSLHLHHP